MTGERDSFEFLLAEKMHRTVNELRQTITQDEYLQWSAYYVWRSAMEKFEWEKALERGPGTGNRD